MATLYTNGAFVTLTPTQFNSYSLIRHSVGQPDMYVLLGFTVSGSVNFAPKLGTVSAEVDGWTGNDAITTGSGHDTIWGNGGNDTLSGGAGNDILFGDWDTTNRVGNDILYGGDGNDELIGGYGNDNLQGGNGDDVFSYGERVAGNDSLFGGAGYDAVSVRDVLGIGLSEVSFNRLILTSAASVEFFAWDDMNVALKGTSGADQIDLSGTLALTWMGGHYEEWISFDLGTGNDSFTGGASAETLTVQGGGDRVLLGAGDDALYVLDGNITGSSINGGAGNDTLILGDLWGVGPGTGLHQVAVTTLAFITTSAFEKVEILDDVQLTGTAAADNFSLLGATEDLRIFNTILMLGGNDRFNAIGYREPNGPGLAVDGGAGNDTLLGSDGDDQLLGGIGNDSLVGGLGNDTYQVDDLGDIVVELADQGFDTLTTTLAAFTLGLTVENLRAVGPGGLVGTGNAQRNQMTGAEGRDHLFGLDGDDDLDGGAGIDTLEGGQGNDRYYVETGDVLIDVSGTDTVVSRAGRWTLAAGFENLESYDDGDLWGTGNAVDNLIVARGGHDRLFGLDGADRLISGAGNDRLDGGTGNDTMYGGLGDDTYVVDSVDDIFDEIADAGNDTILTSLTDVRLVNANIENLAALSGTPGATLRGNDVANRLTGAEGADRLIGYGGDDILDGGAGLDTLIGGDGSDLYLLGRSRDTDIIQEASGQGIDTVAGLADRVALGRNLEVLWLLSAGDAVGIGNELDNRILGGAGNDRLEGLDGHDSLTGGLGADTLKGGAGEDAYYIEDGADRIIEAAGGGGDTALISVGSYVLGRHVETVVVMSEGGSHVIGGRETWNYQGGNGNDTFEGTSGNDSFMGGLGSDMLLGGAGNDTFISGDGSDWIEGGSGDDLYQLDGGTDVIIETADGGTDTVRISAMVYVMADFVENLIIHSDGIDATGNASDNVFDFAFFSTFGDSTLRGGGGNDTFRVTGANVLLYGGDGDDTYHLNNDIFSSVSAKVFEDDGAGFDTVYSKDSIYRLFDGVEMLVLDTDTQQSANGNKLDNVLVGGLATNVLNGLTGDDTLTGGGGRDYFNFTDFRSVDTITDLEWDETLTIESSVFTGFSSSEVSQFILASRFKDLSLGAVDSSDRILFDPVTGRVYYDVDGSGALAAKVFCIIENGLVVTEANFFLG